MQEITQFEILCSYRRGTIQNSSQSHTKPGKKPLGDNCLDVLVLNRIQLYGKTASYPGAVGKKSQKQEKLELNFKIANYFLNIYVQLATGRKRTH